MKIHTLKTPTRSLLCLHQNCPYTQMSGKSHSILINTKIKQVYRETIPVWTIHHGFSTKYGTRLYVSRMIDRVTFLIQSQQHTKTDHGE